jgi:hypothetical protein
MAFPTSNLRLSTVLAAYGRTGGMNALRGVQAWNQDGTSVTVPSTGNFGLLATFGGRYPYNTVSQGPLPFTGTNMSVPNGAIKFVLELIGGGGGGGGAGGSYGSGMFYRSGGRGGGGAGGGYCVTPQLVYNSFSFQNASVSFPSGGAGGQNGFGGNNTADGVGGSPGAQASFLYDSQLYTATGGVGGGGGGRALIDTNGGDGAGGNPGGSFSGPGTTSPPSFNGINGGLGSFFSAERVRQGGNSGGGTTEGRGGDGAGRGGGYGNTGGNGAIYITWYFT